MAEGGSDGESSDMMVEDSEKGETLDPSQYLVQKFRTVLIRALGCARGGVRNGRPLIDRLRNERISVQGAWIMILL